MRSQVGWFLYDEAAEVWWFSVVDVMQVLTKQVDYQTARKYWNQLKRRLGLEGSQLVTSCHQPVVTGLNYFPPMKN